ncbi:hypothetical protein DMENIID0001_081180 [Sergentomyia squamirostris]
MRITDDDPIMAVQHLSPFDDIGDAIDDQDITLTTVVDPRTLNLVSDDQLTVAPLSTQPPSPVVEDQQPLVIFFFLQ